MVTMANHELIAEKKKTMGYVCVCVRDREREEEMKRR